VLDYGEPDLITRHANGFVVSGNQASVIASLYTAERILPGFKMTRAKAFVKGVNPDANNAQSPPILAIH
jgi:hypothetical protein